MSYLKSVFFLLLTLCFCYGSPLFEGKNIKRSQEIVDNINNVVRQLGLAEYEKKDWKMGKFDTMVLRGEKQTVRDEETEEGLKTEVLLKVGWEDLYIEETEQMQFAKASFIGSELTLGVKYLIGKDRGCEAELTELSIDNPGTFQVTVDPPNPGTSSELENHLKETVSHLADINRNLANLRPMKNYIGQAILCAIYK